jgi:RNA polymerase sigma factor (sigma-70 family)
MNNGTKTRRYLVSNEEILILVDLWRNADQSEKNRLANQVVSRLAFLVHSRIRFHKGSPLYDDLLQEGRLGIMRALQDFEPERGRNFFKFATWHIQTRVRRLLQREARRCEVPAGDMLLAGNPAEIPDGLEVRESHSAIIRALSFLSDSDRRVLVMRFGFDGEEPRTFQQIGNELGISKQRAQQIGAGALRRLRRDCELCNLVGG